MPNERQWVARRGDHVAGVLEAHRDGDRLIVDRLLVDPAYRRHGIGLELGQKLIATADLEGWTILAQPRALDGGGMTSAQLERWYRSLGGEGPDADGFLYREPASSMRSASRS